MLFYRVNEKGADTPRFIKKGHNVIECDSDFTLNELYTEKELSRFTHINMNGFTVVQISKRNTFWMFGCRFACSDSIPEIVE